MKPRFLFPALGLTVVMAMTACASEVMEASPSPTIVVPVRTADPEETSLPGVTEISPTQTPSISVVATSRGSNLEATDPTTVSLASGQLQLVEFFRYT